MLACYYSVQTTSTKPPPVLKADIKRVLERMQVQYRDTRTGFECIHMPSIDVTSLQIYQDTRQIDRLHTHGHRKRGSEGSYETDKRSLAKKPSKLSFKTKISKEKEREPSLASNTGASANTTANANGKDKELPSRPSGGTILSASASSASSSFFHVSNAHSNTVEAPGSPGTRYETLDAPTPISPIQIPTLDEPIVDVRSQSPVKPKVLPPIPRDFAPSPQPFSPSPLPTGEVDQDIFESIGANSLAVRFEINIVKVCILIHSFDSLRSFIDLT